MVNHASPRYWDVDRCAWVPVEGGSVAQPDHPAEGVYGAPAGSPDDIPVARSDVDQTGAQAPAGPA